MEKVAAMGWKVPPRFIALTIYLYCVRIWELGACFALHQAHMEGNSPGNPSQKLEAQAYEASTQTVVVREKREGDHCNYLPELLLQHDDLPLGALHHK